MTSDTNSRHLGGHLFLPPLKHVESTNTFLIGGRKQKVKSAVLEHMVENKNLWIVRMWDLQVNLLLQQIHFTGRPHLDVFRSRLQSVLRLPVDVDILRLNNNQENLRVKVCQRTLPHQQHCRTFNVLICSLAVVLGRTDSDAAVLNSTFKTTAIIKKKKKKLSFTARPFYTSMCLNYKINWGLGIKWSRLLFLKSILIFFLNTSDTLEPAVINTHTYFQRSQRPAGLILAKRNHLLWDPACETAGTYQRPFPVRVDGFNVKEKWLHFTPWVHGEGPLNRQTCKGWAPRPLSDTYRTPRGWVWAQCAGGISGTAADLREEVDENRTNSRLAALWEQLVGGRLNAAAGFQYLQVCPGNRPAGSALRLGGTRPGYFPAFQAPWWLVPDDERGLHRTGYRQNVPSKLDSFICQAWALWNVSHSVIVSVCQDVLRCGRAHELWESSPL